MDSKTVEIKGISYHYLELPNPGKPKILFVHGVIVEAHCWESVFQELKNDYHIFAIDLKGHGESGNGKSYLEDYTPEVIAHDLFQFYEKVIQEPFYLVGHSLGGQFGMAYAGQFSSTLKGIVIMDSAPSVPMKGVFHLLLADAFTPKGFKSKEDIQKFYGRGGESIGKYMADYCFIQKSDGKYQLRYDKKNIGTTSMMENMRRNKYLWDSFKKIKVPCLFIKAGKSKVITNSMIMMMKGFMTKMEVFVVNGANHHELTFQWAKDISVEIRNFFKKN